MAKSSAEYIALNPANKSEAFRAAFADMQDAHEAHQEHMRTLGAALMEAALAEGFKPPVGKAARIVTSRFDGKPQIMLSDAVQRRSF